MKYNNFFCFSLDFWPPCRSITMIKKVMLMSMTHLINQLNPEALESDPLFGNCV